VRIVVHGFTMCRYRIDCPSTRLPVTSVWKWCCQLCDGDC